MMVALPNHPSASQVHNAARGLADVYGQEAKPQSVCLDTFLDEDTEFIQFLEAIQAEDDTRQREQRPGYTATEPTFCTSSSVQYMEPIKAFCNRKNSLRYVDAVIALCCPVRTCVCWFVADMHIPVRSG